MKRLRTRSSFSIGVAELGGYPLVIDKSGSQLGRGEPISDTTEVLTRMAYAIVWRTFEQSRIEEMASVATVPVVNALTDEFHPCQVLADFLTIAQFKGGVDALAGMTIAYLGDAANNMANSYLLAGAVAGMHVRVSGPNGFLPDDAIVQDAEATAADSMFPTIRDAQGRHIGYDKDFDKNTKEAYGITLDQIRIKSIAPYTITMKQQRFELFNKNEKPDMQQVFYYDADNNREIILWERS